MPTILQLENRDTEAAEFAAGFVGGVNFSGCEGINPLVEGFFVLALVDVR